METVMILFLSGIGLIVFGMATAKAKNGTKDTGDTSVTNSEFEEKERLKKLEEVEQNKQYLLGVANKCIAELVPFGLSKERATDLVDELELCSEEEHYLKFIEKCKSIRDDLVGARIVSLKEMLEVKKAGPSKKDRIDLIELSIEQATSMEQLDLIERNIKGLSSPKKQKAS